MSFAEAVRSVFRQYAGFEGRARRSEYWWFAAFVVLVTWVPYALALLLVSADGGGLSGQTPEGGPGTIIGVGLIFAVGIGSLALIIPAFAVLVRRLHDTGRTGWWYFISLVPFVGTFLLLVLLALDSEPGTNRHGRNPKLPEGLPGYGQQIAAPYGSSATLLPGGGLPNRFGG